MSDRQAPAPPQPPSLHDLLVGVWDCYAGGYTTELILQADGRYSNTCFSAGTAHWGQWSLMPGPGSTYLRFTLQGAQPRVYVGPLGTVPIHWPPSETWVIVGVQPDQIAVQGGTMTRRAATPRLPWGMSGNPFPFPGTSPSAQTPPSPAASQAPSAGPPLAETIKMWTEANKKTQEKFKEMHDKTQATYDKINKMWSDYIKS